MITMETARLAVKMEDTLATMKGIYGGRWNEVAEPYRVVLRGVMKDSGITSVLTAVLPIAKGMAAKGESPLMLLAVAVEMASSENVRGQRTRHLVEGTLDPLVGDFIFIINDRQEVVLSAG